MWPQILALAGALVPKVFKKRAKYCLWYRSLAGAWTKKAGPFSARQCKKTRKELIRLGADPERFSILREGVRPPEKVS